MQIASMQITGASLAQLWSTAIIFAPHLAGCPCAGGFHVPLDPAAVEEDLMDFLAFRYRTEGLDPLERLVAARARDRRRTFRDWLLDLDTVEIAESERRRILEDLHTTLASMNDMGGGARAGFVCY